MGPSFWVLLNIILSEANAFVNHYQRISSEWRHPQKGKAKKIVCSNVLSQYNIRTVPKFGMGSRNWGMGNKKRRPIFGERVLEKK